ncbi:MAG: tetratricopeptide repeat protein [Anaerolineae bacterium]
MRKKVRRGKKPKRFKRRPALSRQDKAALELLEEFASPEIAREYRKALQLIRRGRVSEGVESLIRLGQQEQVGDLILYNKLTHLYIEYGAVHKALAPYEKADHTEEVQEFRVYSELAAAYCQAKRYEDARRIYLKRMRLLEQDNPERQMDTRVDIADTYNFERRYSRACQEFENLWEESPQSGLIAHELVMSYLRLGFKDKAREMCRSVVAGDIDDEVYRGKAYLGLRQPQEALPLFQKAVQMYPADGFPPFYLALIYLMLDQPAPARENLELSLENMPDVWDDEQELFAQFILTPAQYRQLVNLWPK